MESPIAIPITSGDVEAEEEEEEEEEEERGGGYNIGCTTTSTREARS